MTKTCRECGETKPLDGFSARKRRCKRCFADARAAERAAFGREPRGFPLTWVEPLARILLA